MIVIGKNDIIKENEMLYSNLNIVFKGYVKAFFGDDIFRDFEYIVINQDEIHICTNEIVRNPYSPPAVTGYGFALSPYIGIWDNIQLHEIEKNYSCISKNAVFFLFAMYAVSSKIVINEMYGIGSLLPMLKELIKNLPSNFDFFMDVEGSYITINGVRVTLEEFIVKGI